MKPPSNMRKREIKLNGEVIQFVSMCHCTVTTNTAHKHSQTEVKCKQTLKTVTLILNKYAKKWITPQRRMWIIMWINRNKELLKKVRQTIEFVKENFRELVAQSWLILVANCNKHCAKINQSLSWKGVFNLAVTQLSICQIMFTFLAIYLSRHCCHNSRIFVQHVNKNSFDHKMKYLHFFVFLKWL